LAHGVPLQATASKLRIGTQSHAQYSINSDELGLSGAQLHQRNSSEGQFGARGGGAVSAFSRVHDAFSRSVYQVRCVHMALPSAVSLTRSLFASTCAALHENSCTGSVAIE
jgi:hypothetical protein